MHNDMIVRVAIKLEDIIMHERKCEYCCNNIKVRDKRQIGRFCSSLCNRKLLRTNQLKKHNEYLKNETDEDRLEWLKSHYEKFVIKKNKDCWDWSGAKSNGYGNFNHRGKIMKAHRASWLIHKGAIPNDLFVLHKCDNCSCSNPDHLFLGNHTDNMRDMASKFRTKVRCKLNLEQVYEIKKLLTLGVSSMNLSRKFGVSDVTIHNIKHAITWKCAA
jgi:HNH endonuclease